MPQPEECDFLALVSEWTGSGGRVGNCYPLVNLTTAEVIDNPKVLFCNAGAVFLPYRGALRTWDFVLLRPRANDRYQNAGERDCYYIPARPPEPLGAATQSETAAVVLDAPNFDPGASARQILLPRHNVTPIFFVRKGQTLFGPLLREAVTLSAMEDVQRIDWRPADEEGVVYEISRDDLTRHGVKLVEYSHPDPQLNRVLDSPIALAVGPVRRVTSPRRRDSLPNAALLDWYLQRCPAEEVSADQLAAVRAAFKAGPADDPAILQSRLMRVERELASHAIFAEHRERFARQYAESDEGRKRVSALIEQVAAKQATEIRAEVARRESELAARRDELERLLAEAEEQHHRRLDELEKGEREAGQKIEGLHDEAEKLRQKMVFDVKKLGDEVREQLPIFAALSHSLGTPVYSNPSSPASPVAAPARDFRPISPSATLKPVADEGRLVEELHSALSRRGLFFARDFVANVYVSFKAEPLNLIGGPPGYGKSVLVAALAECLGHGDALLRIAVRRSWAEDRHLLGFFDGFHGRYDPGPTGLVPMMLRAQADWQGDKRGVYVVLLDEFNLAAPEYYFSQLLQALPGDESAKEIRLYDAGAGGDGFPDRVRIAPNMRFWGTINYDETTERLSPRALDRTGMIFLGDADLRQSSGEAEGPAPALGVSAADLFGKLTRTAADCPEDRWELVAKVIDLLRSPDAALGPRVELSPRVRKAIRRYLANSVNVLEPKVAADFAVQQRILPVVRGRGDDFTARMERLGQLLAEASLPRSAAHVAEALRRARGQFGDLDFLGY